MIVVDKRNLIQALRDLSDERFQRDTWMHGKLGVVSSFPELICQVFDDTGLSDALDSDVLESQVSSAAAETLRNLSALIDRMPKNQSASVLVSSPDMREVRRLAGQALRQLMALVSNKDVSRRSG